MKRPVLLTGTLAAFTVVFWFLSNSEILAGRRLESRDALFAMRRASSDPPAEIRDVAIITIDDESCARLGARWPWPRALIESLVAGLSRQGARVLALNLSFSGLEGGSEESTRLLADTLKAHGRAVLGSSFDNAGRLLKPHPILSEAAASGFLEKIVDPDYRIRRSYLLRPMKFGSKSPVASLNLFESSFPLKIASLALGPARLERRPGGLVAHFSLADGTVTEVLLEEDGSYPVNYLAGESDFTAYPAWKVIEGKLPSGALSNKIVFVGLTSSLFSEKKEETPIGLLFGVYLHANEYISLASGRFLHFIPGSVALTLSWLVSLAILVLWVLRQFVWAALTAAVVSVVLFFGSQALFAVDWVIEPFDLLFGPLLSVVFGIVANLAFLLLENKGLETKVIRDKMTGLYTYEYLRARLDVEWKRCQKMRVPVAIAMTDLDRFKKINDTLGHETGNQMILRAAEVIRRSVRGYDVVSRYGGDEFVILLWHSSIAEARAYRERLRGQYHAMAGKLEDPLLRTSSVSIGVAAYDPNDEVASPKTAQELVEAADKDLFEDKESRRKPGEASR